MVELSGLLITGPTGFIGAPGEPKTINPACDLAGGETLTYREMVKLFIAYAPWKLGVHRIWHHFARPWVSGFKHHPINSTMFFAYVDIDVSAQKKGQQ